MNVEDVGGWNFCPHCARPLIEGDYVVNDFEDMVCSCCNRPWIACPCTPASEGPCKAVKPEPERNAPLQPDED